VCNARTLGEKKKQETLFFFERDQRGSVMASSSPSLTKTADAFRALKQKHIANQMKANGPSDSSSALIHRKVAPMNSHTESTFDPVKKPTPKLPVEKKRTSERVTDVFHKLFFVMMFPFRNLITLGQTLLVQILVACGFRAAPVQTPPVSWARWFGRFVAAAFIINVMFVMVDVWYSPNTHTRNHLAQITLDYCMKRYPDPADYTADCLRNEKWANRPFLINFMSDVFQHIVANFLLIGLWACSILGIPLSWCGPGTHCYFLLDYIIDAFVHYAAWFIPISFTLTLLYVAYVGFTRFMKRLENLATGFVPGRGMVQHPLQYASYASSSPPPLPPHLTQPQQTPHHMSETPSHNTRSHDHHHHHSTLPVMPAPSHTTYQAPSYSTATIPKPPAYHASFPAVDAFAVPPPMVYSSTSTPTTSTPSVYDLYARSAPSPTSFYIKPSQFAGSASNP
jgi:hypothetical protein